MTLQGIRRFAPGLMHGSQPKRQVRRFTLRDAPHRLFLAIFAPALPLFSVPIVAFSGVMDRYVFDKHGIENLQ